MEDSELYDERPIDRNIGSYNAFDADKFICVNAPFISLQSDQEKHKKENA